MTDKNVLGTNEVLAAIGEHFHDIPIISTPATSAAITAKTETESEVFALFKESIFYGEPPPVWQIDADASSEMNRFALRPNIMHVLGGAPGAGKTCFLGEMILKALLLDPKLKILFTNVEMSATQLLERMLASQARVPLGDIIARHRSDTNLKMLQEGMARLESIHERLRFMSPPFTIENVLANAKRFGANVVIVDYLQRVRLENGGKGLTSHDVINILMERLRLLAQSGVCVICVSALSRDSTASRHGGVKDKVHRTGITGFRGSSELEYAPDFCWVLDTPDAAGTRQRR